jgi:anti-anti-sigma factor
VRLSEKRSPTLGLKDLDETKTRTTESVVLSTSVELTAGRGTPYAAFPVFRLQGRLTSSIASGFRRRSSPVPPAHTVWLPQSELPAVGETQKCGRAAFEVHHLTAERVRIAVTGEIDATNRQALGRFVERHIRISQQLVVDLCKVDFFDSQGFTALYYVSVHCARRDVDWMIVGNRVVDRILRICDSEGELPVVDDLGAAVDRLDRCAKYHHTPSWAG